MLNANDVITFWFTECTPEDWWAGEPDFDARIAARFTKTHERAALGEAFTWRATPEGRLAEIIVLDQFSRQLFRNGPRAFASDSMALALAQEAVAGGHDQQVSPDRRAFFYLPYEHSESLLIHEQSEKLFLALGDDNLLQFERDHAAVIHRFGRFPKRNAALGRVSTPEEEKYLAEAGDRAF